MKELTLHLSIDNQILSLRSASAEGPTWQLHPLRESSDGAYCLFLDLRTINVQCRLPKEKQALHLSLYHTEIPGRSSLQAPNIPSEKLMLEEAVREVGRLRKANKRLRGEYKIAIEELRKATRQKGPA